MKVDWLVEPREILENLEGHEGRMDSKSAKFVERMRTKFELYGDRTFVSRDQIFWLRDLNNKYVLGIRG